MPMVVRLVNSNELESESWLKKLGFINPTVDNTAFVAFDFPHCTSPYAIVAGAQLYSEMRLIMHGRYIPSKNTECNSEMWS